MLTVTTDFGDSNITATEFVSRTHDPEWAEYELVCYLYYQGIDRSYQDSILEWFNFCRADRFTVPHYDGTQDTWVWVTE